MENQKKLSDDNDRLVILLREEQSVYHYSCEPEFVRECYKSCAIEKDEEILVGAGAVWIDNVEKTDEDYNVTFSYYDAQYCFKKGYVSLGQEVSFQLMEDDHNPYNYVLSKCSLSITSKRHADDLINSPDNNRIIQRRTKKYTNKKSS